jgi:NAD-dependent dihydropyrimidine dehydrogenase PreA subunit
MTSPRQEIWSGDIRVSPIRSRRERFPWFPTIHREECLLDLECLNFCPAGVFDWDPATGNPVVVRPLDCIPGCRTCAENCKARCISLPSKKQVAAALKRIRAEEGIDPSPRPEKQQARAAFFTTNHAANKGKARRARSRSASAIIAPPAAGNKPVE